MNQQELQAFQEKERTDKERTDKAEQQTKAATEKENVWKSDAQKKEFDNHEKAIKDNVVKEQKALGEAYKKESERVKSLQENGKEKGKEPHYNPVYDRAGIEREQYKRDHPQPQQQRQPRHYDRQGENGMTRELNNVKQVMCKTEATKRLDNMSPEQRDTLKKSFEADMEKGGDNRKLTDAGVHHKLSEKIMDDRGVPREDHTDMVGIAEGQRGMGRDVTPTDIMNKHEKERYLPEKAQAHDHGKGKEPKGHDRPAPDGAPVRDPQGPDRPGPAPAHAHARAKPWHEKHGGHPDHFSTKLQDKAHAIGEKPWKNQSADPDRAESRMAAQARAREQER